jgi:type VI secretion system protein ImpH
VATEVGRADPSLAELLFRRPYEFDFFQAVRLLSLMHPSRQMLSRLNEGLSESIRFRALASLNFPPSSIAQLIAGDPIAMTVAFMGLTGPIGVLPEHYTEYMIARLFEKDTSTAAFFDLFNHRFIALFYQAWAKHDVVASYEHEQATKSNGRGLSQYVFDLIGMGTTGLRGRLRVPDEALLLYSGLIAQSPHSASALRGMLEDYFHLPVEIEQFVGRWISLVESDLSYLSPEGLHNQLGIGAIAGDQVWNQQAGFRVQLGPITYKRFVHFLPGGQAFSKLVNLTRFFAGRTLEFDVQLILQAAEVPWCQLSDDPASPRLGWSTWLKTEDFTRDARDTILVAAN